MQISNSFEWKRKNSSRHCACSTKIPANDKHVRTDMVVALLLPERSGLATQALGASEMDAF